MAKIKSLNLRERQARRSMAEGLKNRSDPNARIDQLEDRVIELEATLDRIIKAMDSHHQSLQQWIDATESLEDEMSTRILWLMYFFKGKKKGIIEVPGEPIQVEPLYEEYQRDRDRFRQFIDQQRKAAEHAQATQAAAGRQDDINPPADAPPLARGPARVS